MDRLIYWRDREMDHGQCLAMLRYHQRLGRHLRRRRRVWLGTGSARRGNAAVRAQMRWRARQPRQPAKGICPRFAGLRKTG
eukprot:5007183-Alexandrium_andersonii.AAC.1